MAVVSNALTKKKDSVSYLTTLRMITITAITMAIKGGDYLMTSWITELLIEIEKNKIETDKLACQTAIPFMLIGKDGEPFSVVGNSRGHFFVSHFFTGDKCR